LDWIQGRGQWCGRGILGINSERPDEDLASRYGEH
jgi:hypothetical protein